MGRFDYPSYKTEDDVASVWLVTDELSSLPPDYFQEVYGDDDDAEFSVFSAETRIGWYDHDFQESLVTSGHDAIPVRDLIAQASFGGSFAEAVAEAAARRGIDVAWLAWIHYNMRYDSEVSGVTDTQWVTFVGVFDFETD